MIIPNPIILSKPLHIWLGFLALILLLIQIGIGKKIIKVPFWFHMKVVWVILLLVVLVHGFIGFELYFLR